MRARILLAAGVASTMVGCSRPPAEEEMKDLEANLQRALAAAAAESVTAVASELEAPRPEPPQAPPPEQAIEQTEEEVEVAVAGVTPETSVEPPAIEAPPANTLAPPPPEPLPNPEPIGRAAPTWADEPRAPRVSRRDRDNDEDNGSARATRRDRDDDDDDDDDRARRGQRRAQGYGIIIRGGGSSGRDPCARHNMLRAQRDAMMERIIREGTSRANSGTDGGANTARRRSSDNDRRNITWH